MIDEWLKYLSLTVNDSDYNSRLVSSRPTTATVPPAKMMIASGVRR